MGRNLKHKNTYYTIKSLNLPTNFEKSSYSKSKYIKQIDYNNVKEYVVKNKHLGFIDCYKVALYLKNTYIAYRRLQVSALKGLAGRAIAKMSELESIDGIPVASSNDENGTDKSQITIVDDDGNDRSSDDNAGDDGQNRSNGLIVLEDLKVNQNVDPDSIINLDSDSDNDIEIVGIGSEGNISQICTRKRKKRVVSTVVNNKAHSIVPVCTIDLIHDENEDDKRPLKKKKDDAMDCDDPMKKKKDDAIDCDDPMKKLSVGVEEHNKGNNSRASATSGPNISISGYEDKVPQISMERSSLIPKKISFQNVAGYKDVLKEISRLVMHFRYSDIYAETCMSTPTGFLIHGPSGCGKSHIVTALAGDLNVPLIKVAAPQLIGGVLGESEQLVRSVFMKALKLRPAILFIDEIDAISKDRGNSDNSMEDRVVAQLLCCMEEINEGERCKPLMVIGATNQIHKIDPALRRAGRFDKEIVVGMPDCETRFAILQYLSMKHNLNLSPDICLRELARLTPGFVAVDVKSLIIEAYLSAFQRYTEKEECSERESGSFDIIDLTESDTDSSDAIVITKSDFLYGLKSVQPSLKREGFITVPHTTWDDIGSLSGIRRELQKAFLTPIKYSSIYNSMGLSISGGVLLYGPPGCGKTLMAKAFANEAGINFLAVNGPELLNKYVGGSEMAVRACFQRARVCQPCVIFFDEIDAICAKRDDDSSVHANRVVNQLLTEMDGLRSRTGVFIMAATNRYDILDPAILRPGRFDKSFYVGVPKNPDERYQILKALTKNGTKPCLAEDVNLDEIAFDSRCDDCTGADLSAVVKEAGILAVEEVLSRCSNTDNEEHSPIVVSRQHFKIGMGVLGRNLFYTDSELSWL